MRRRDFLAGTVALPAFLRVAPRTPSRAGTRFGYAAITWGGRDEAAIDDISSLGFGGVQLRLSAVERWGARPAALRELLAGRKLSFVALSSGTLSLDPAAERDERAAHLRNARFVRDAGGTFLQVIDVRPSGRAPTASDFARMARLLSALGQRVADLGVTLAYHHHMGALGQAPDEVDAVLSQSDPRYVRLLFDIAHWRAAGGDPATALPRYADRLAFLHMKDVVLAAPDAQGQRHRFVELGRGVVDLPAVMAALSRMGYDGWGMVELDAVTAPALTPRECAQISKDYLASIGYPI
jgi:inosose dehydratase